MGLSHLLAIARLDVALAVIIIRSESQEEGRFFFARGQNFPLQLATVEVAGPHKNT